jgi:hypothetical protein
MSGISNHYDALTAIKTLIDGLSLSGLDGGVVIQEVAWHEKGVTNTTLPFISVSPFGSESTGDANSNEDEVGYPILIAILASPCATELETRLGWRQKIRRRLRNASLYGQARNFNLIPEPLACVDLAAWRLKLFGSAIVVRCLYEEPRT